MNKRIAIYLLTGVGLTVAYAMLRGNTWTGSGQLHTLMEALATALAMIVGIIALLRFYTRKNNTFLFIGTGFLGTAFLDGYHAIVTSTYFRPFMPSGNESLIPWSWVASREFLSIFMLLSYLAWVRESKLGQRGEISERTVYIFSIMFTVTCFLFFALVPLPRAYYPEYVFHRPEEFLPAIFFGLALVGYLRKGLWRVNVFEHWLVLSLIVGFVSQAVFMSFSGALFDFEFDAAHTLKKVSYICVLTGLLFNMFEIYSRAEEANRAKSDFLNIMSHELRTPLTVILGYTPILANPGKLPSTKRLMAMLESKEGSHADIQEGVLAVLGDISKYVEKMGKSGDHLLSLINDMLDLSKIEAGKMEIELKSISVDSIVGSVVEQFDKAASDKHLIIKQKTNGGTVFADEIRLKQILINLVGNAIKFTDSGSIILSTSHRGSVVEFQIKDTGCGISSTEFESVFDRFKQSDESDTRKAGGTGLGLAITKRLVEMHGGSISVFSEIDLGSTFRFTIPSDR